MMSCALHLKGAEAGETRGSVWAHAVYVCLCVNHAARFIYYFWLRVSTLECFMYTCTVGYCKYRAFSTAELSRL